MERVVGGRRDTHTAMDIVTVNSAEQVAIEMYKATSRKCRLTATQGENCEYKYSREEGLEVFSDLSDLELISIFEAELLNKKSAVFTGNVTRRIVERARMIIWNQDTDKPVKPFIELERVVGALEKSIFMQRD